MGVYSGCKDKSIDILLFYVISYTMGHDLGVQIIIGPGEDTTMAKKTKTIVLILLMLAVFCQTAPSAAVLGLNAAADDAGVLVSDGIARDDELTTIVESPPSTEQPQDAVETETVSDNTPQPAEPEMPTEAPTQQTTAEPTEEPSEAPTQAPTPTNTPIATVAPTELPTEEIETTDIISPEAPHEEVPPEDISENFVEQVQVTRAAGQHAAQENGLACYAGEMVTVRYSWNIVSAFEESQTFSFPFSPKLNIADTIQQPLLAYSAGAAGVMGSVQEIGTIIISQNHTIEIQLPHGLDAAAFGAFSFDAQLASDLEIGEHTLSFYINPLASQNIPLTILAEPTQGTEQAESQNGEQADQDADAQTVQQTGAASLTDFAVHLAGQEVSAEATAVLSEQTGSLQLQGKWNVGASVQAGDTLGVTMPDAFEMHPTSGMPISLLVDGIAHVVGRFSTSGAGARGGHTQGTLVFGGEGLSILEALADDVLQGVPLVIDGSFAFDGLGEHSVDFYGKTYRFLVEGAANDDEEALPQEEQVYIPNASLTMSGARIEESAEDAYLFAWKIRAEDYVAHDFAGQSITINGVLDGAKGHTMLGSLPQGDAFTVRFQTYTGQQLSYSGLNGPADFPYTITPSAQGFSFTVNFPESMQGDIATAGILTIVAHSSLVVDEGDTVPEAVAASAQWGGYSGAARVVFKPRDNMLMLRGGQKEIEQNMWFSKVYLAANGSAPVLEGAKFSMYKKIDGSYVYMASAVSNKIGQVIFPGMTSGEYRFVEIAAPDGFIVSDRVIDYELVPVYENPPENGDHPYSVNILIDEECPDCHFFNERGALQSVYFAKHDEANQALSGATFQLAKKDGVTGAWIDVAQATSGDDGMVRFAGLDWGEYQIREISAPVGYEVSDRTIEFALQKGQAADQPIDVSGGAPFVNARNDYPQNVHFFKTNIFGDPLSGALFGLYKENASGTYEKLAEATSQANGKVSFSDLYAGTYQIREIEVPSDEYELSDDVITFTLDANDKGEHIDKDVNDGKPFYNNQINRKSVYFYKQDEAQVPLAGMTFALYRIKASGQGEDFIKLGVSEKDGRVFFGDLSYGKYVIREEKVIDGFLLSDEEITFELTKDTQGDSIHINEKKPFINKRLEQRQGVYFFKMDDALIPIPNTAFGLYRWSDADGDYTESIGEATADKDGRVTFSDLMEGKYEIREVKPQPGYEPSTKAIRFSLQKATQPGVMTHVNGAEPFINERIKFLQGVYFFKTDEISQPIPGTEFALYTKEAQTGLYTELVQTSKADGTGRVSFADLEAGEYEIREEKEMPGHEISDETIRFTLDPITEQKPDLHVNAGKPFINPRILQPQGVYFMKVDNKHAALAGAVFQLYKFNLNSGAFEFVSQATSDGSGRVQFMGLYAGQYEIREVKAPDGYVINPKPITFTLVDQTQAGVMTHVNGEAAFVNEPGTFFDGDQSVYFYKVDAGKSPLGGAVFELYGFNAVTGKYDLFMQRASSLNNGRVEFAGLPEGRYRIVETVAPSGYHRSDRTIDFVLKADAVPGAATHLLSETGYINYVKTGSLPKTGDDGNAIYIAIIAAALAGIFITVGVYFIRRRGEER